MEVLSIVSQKGGTGKTTLATHLSVEAERNGHGHTVALIDLGPPSLRCEMGRSSRIRFSSGYGNTNITIETLVRNCSKQRGNACDY